MPTSKKPDILRNLKVSHVSYVTKGANKKTFFLTKDEDDERKDEFAFDVKIMTNIEKEDVDGNGNTNQPKNLVYGVVAEPDSVDTYNHIIKADEIENACHKFMENFRKIDEMHDYIEGAGHVVESYIAPVDMEMDNGDVIKKGSWVLVTKADDKIWNKIQKGEYTGYSLAGKANVIVQKNDENIIKLEKLNISDDLMSVIKGAFNDVIDEQDRSFTRYLDVLMWVAYDNLWSDKTNDEIKKNILDAIDEFKTKIFSISEIEFSDNSDNSIDNVENHDEATSDESLSEDNNSDESQEQSDSQNDDSQETTEQSDTEKHTNENESNQGLTQEDIAKLTEKAIKNGIKKYQDENTSLKQELQKLNDKVLELTNIIEENDTSDIDDAQESNTSVKKNNEQIKIKNTLEMF